MSDSIREGWSASPTAVAGIGHRQQQVREAFLGSDERQRLALGIEAKPVAFLVPSDGGMTQRRRAGVQAHNRWMVDWCSRYPTQRADGTLRSTARSIRPAPAKKPGCCSSSTAWWIAR